MGAPELLIILALLAVFALPIVGIVDAARRPSTAWQSAGQNQTLWIVLMAVGIFVCGVGAVLAIVYLAAIRPQVARAQGL